MPNSKRNLTCRRREMKAKQKPRADYCIIYGLVEPQRRVTGKDRMGSANQMGGISYYQPAP